MDTLLHEWKSDLLRRIWIPLIAGAAMLIGLLGGIEIPRLPRFGDHGGSKCRHSRSYREGTGTESSLSALLEIRLAIDGAIVFWEEGVSDADEERHTGVHEQINRLACEESAHGRIGCKDKAGQRADARSVADGIRAVLTNVAKSYSFEYPCHSAAARRWFV
jgi:hypothetical protein